MGIRNELVGLALAALGYVAPGPVAISHGHPIGRWKLKLRSFRIPVPIPYSGFVFFHRISSKK